VHIDHMNDHKGYSKLLASWAKQLKLSGLLFLSLQCDPRPRHVFLVLDSPSTLGGTGEFLTRLRTQNVDVNMRGQPCQERMSAIVAELALPHCEALVPGMEVIDCEGGKKSQAHLPFVREFLRERRPHDAEALISAIDRFLDETTKPGTRRQAPGPGTR
jgi:hypothetical protein